MRHFITHGSVIWSLCLAYTRSVAWILSFDVGFVVKKYTYGSIKIVPAYTWRLSSTVTTRAENNLRPNKIRGVVIRTEALHSYHLGIECQLGNLVQVLRNFHNFPVTSVHWCKKCRFSTAFSITCKMLKFYYVCGKRQLIYIFKLQ
jgi:hypothetical protein